MHVEPTRQCKNLVDRNSIGFLFSHGRTSLYWNTALRSITLIRAGLTRTLSFVLHITRLDHTPIGSSIAVKKNLVDRNSIGLLFSHGQKSLDWNTALRSITLIGAGLTRTFSFGQHITRLDHTPIGSSIVVKLFRFRMIVGVCVFLP